MQQLSYQTLRETGYKGYIPGRDAAPVRVLQFGEGNFLRAFAEYWFDMANERAGWNGKIAMVQPRGQSTSPCFSDVINQQEGLYTLYLRGCENGKRIDRKRVISAVSACYNPLRPSDWKKVRKIAVSPALEYIVSNTTEAGIVYAPEPFPDRNPPASFPAKLTVLLHDRYKAGLPGVTVLPCELIDRNGQELKRCVQKYLSDWALGKEFSDYIENSCTFCSTLVDRIVSGSIRNPDESRAMDEENGYADRLKDVGEVFGVWYIEGPEELEKRLPFKKAGLNVHVVPDAAPYKKRKVRILNGAHTGFAPGAYLAGQDIVRDCMHDEVIHGFMNRLLYDEVIPVLSLDRKECEAFAAAVTDRFSNPFVDHQLLSIALNSTSKWKARDLPSLLEYVSLYGKLPDALCMGFAAYIAFCSTSLQRREKDALIGRRERGNEYRILDDPWILDFYWNRRNESDASLAHDVLSCAKMWDQDLTLVQGLEGRIISDLVMIRKDGAKAAFASVLQKKGSTL